MQQHLVDDDEGLRRILKEARTVAVLGAKSGRGEPAHYVPAYLQQRGYRIVPVNPMLAGQTVLGETVLESLAALGSRSTSSMSSAVPNSSPATRGRFSRSRGVRARSGSSSASGMMAPRRSSRPRESTLSRTAA